MIHYRHGSSPCTATPAAARALVEIEAAAWVAAHPGYLTDVRFEMASEARRPASELDQAARQARRVLAWLDDAMLDATGRPATVDPTPPRRPTPWPAPPTPAAPRGTQLEEN